MSYLYKSYSVASVSRLKSRATNILEEWFSDKFQIQPALTINVTEVSILPSENDCLIGNASARSCQLAILATDDAVRRLLPLLDSEHPALSGRIGEDARYISRRIYLDLLDEFQQQINVNHHSEMHASLATKYVTKGGWYTMEAGIDGVASIYLYIGPAAIDALISKARPGHVNVDLTSRAEAIEEKLLTLSAVIGPTSISLEEICSLSEGDVISLDQSVDEGVSIRHSSGETLFSGSIGKQNGKHALVLS